MQPDQIATDAIDIWTWSLDADTGQLASYSELLSDDETARSARFIHDRDRRFFIVGRGRLREILATYGESVDPCELTFDYNGHGKPRIGERHGLGLHFNLSHSADLAVLAVSPHYEIGVDIEEKKALQEDVAAHFFSAKERASLQEVPVDRYLDHFYRCWTRKEAFVKAHGAGLSLPLDAFDVTFGEEDAPRLERLEGDPEAPVTWSLFHMQTPANFAGAVAAQTFGNTARLRYR
jgi:4'-phosphopantetheinyl transferase